MKDEQEWFAVKNMLLTKQIDWDRRPYKSFDLFLSPSTHRGILAICECALSSENKEKETFVNCGVRDKEKLSKNLWYCVMWMCATLYIVLLARKSNKALKRFRIKCGESLMDGRLYSMAHF